MACVTSNSRRLGKLSGPLPIVEIVENLTFSKIKIAYFLYRESLSRIILFKNVSMLPTTGYCNYSHEVDTARVYDIYHSTAECTTKYFIVLCNLCPTS